MPLSEGAAMLRPKSHFRRERLAFEGLESRLVLASIPAPTGITNWWPGNGNADDVIGGNDGIPMNGASFAAGFVTSGNGQAFDFDGVDDYVLTSAVQIPSEFTFEGWVRRNGLSPTNDFILGVCNDPNSSCGGSDYSFVGWYLGADGTIGADYSPTTWGTRRLSVASSPGVIMLNTWYHVALVIDANANTSQLFVNGVDVSALSPSGNVGSGGGSFVGAISFGALNDANTGIPFRHLNATVDELAFYDRTLDTSEIQAIFNSGSDGKITPVVANALENAGIDAADVPEEVIDALMAAEQQGLLTVISSGTSPDNVTLEPNGVVVLGDGAQVDNIEGGSNTTVVLGQSVDVNGNIDGVESVFIGGGDVDGNIIDVSQLTVAPGTTVNINGNVDAVDVSAMEVGSGSVVNINGNAEMATLKVLDDAVVDIDGNLDFSDSLELGLNSTLDVAGNLNCSPTAMAIIDPTATVIVDGNNECPAAAALPLLWFTIRPQSPKSQEREKKSSRTRTFRTSAICVDNVFFEVVDWFFARPWSESKHCVIGATSHNR